MWEGPGSSDASVASDVASRCPGEPLLTREVVGLGREGEPGWLSAVAAGRAAGRGAEGTRSRAARFFNAIPQWLSSFFLGLGKAAKSPFLTRGAPLNVSTPGGTTAAAARRLTAETTSGPGRVSCHRLSCLKRQAVCVERPCPCFSREDSGLSFHACVAGVCMEYTRCCCMLAICSYRCPMGVSMSVND